jgi:ribose transport system substrate-binding protein
LSQEELFITDGIGMRRRYVPLVFVAATVVSVAVCFRANAQTLKSTADKRIAFSNFYAGNSWRQAMLQSWTDSANQAIKDGIIKATKIVNANNSASEQASQIESLIVEGWDAIVVDPISTTAINSAIQDAVDAHIDVVIFNESSTAPGAYHIVTDYTQDGRLQAEFLGKQFKDPANILEIRGIAGTSADADMHNGLVDGLKSYPNLKIVGTVYGNWTGTVTQKEVAGILPSLPKIDAVATQGGDGWGAYQAFHAAGRPTPIIIMGHRQDELALWKQILETDPTYNTFSVSSTPAGSKVAFWVAQQILAGRNVPKTLNLPFPIIKKGDLDAWLKVMPQGSVALVPYTQKWTEDFIDAVVAGKPAPPPPRPTGNSD